MVSTIKRGASKDEIRSLFLKIEKKNDLKKGFDAFKFCGVVKFKADALEIQKGMRDEWK